MSDKHEKAEHDARLCYIYWLNLIALISVHVLHGNQLQGNALSQGLG